MFNTFYIVKNNTENLLRSNLEQARSTLDVWLGSYEDILFQIYMNDENRGYGGRDQSG